MSAAGKTADGGPLISVLLPVRDGEATLGAALRCLRRQHGVRLEILVADDGSRDGSRAVAERAARADGRIRVLAGPAAGLVPTLNRALAGAAGAFVGRMDADDLCSPDRFLLQLRHLRRHPRLDAVGTRIRLFPARRATAGMRRFVAWQNRWLTHRALHANHLVDAPLFHGSGLFRAAGLRAVGGWRDYDGPEDFDLWIRGLRAGWRIGKVNRDLYSWRERPGSLTRENLRYTRDAFRRRALDAVTAGHPPGDRFTVWGWGGSLAWWCEALRATGHRVEAVGVNARAVRGGAPLPPAPPREFPGWILAYGAARSRDTLSRRLAEAGRRSGSDYRTVS